MAGACARPQGPIRLAPTTRAIRAALAVSATMLALSGSGVALAGTCLADAPTNTVTCNGVFSDDVINSVDPGDIVEDMTLVVGTDGNTTVVPAAGSSGITADWAGDVTVVNYADISTVGVYSAYAASIVEYGSGSATLLNYGNVHAQDGYSAVDISAYGDVTVVNGGMIEDVSTGTFGVYAIAAYSAAGNVDVANQAGAVVYAAGASATAVAMYGQGNASLENDGELTAVADYFAYGAAVGAAGDASVTIGDQGAVEVEGKYATAVHVTTFGGTASVDNAGYLHAVGTTFAANGIIAVGQDAVYVHNSGEIVAESDAREVAIGVRTLDNDAYIQVENSGTLHAAAGILANGYGDIVVENSGTIDASRGGIFLSGFSGSATVDNSGTISVIGASMPTTYFASASASTPPASGDRQYRGDPRRGGPRRRHHRRQLRGRALCLQRGAISVDRRFLRDRHGPSQQVRRRRRRPTRAASSPRPACSPAASSP
jgi:hypothetical protein